MRRMWFDIGQVPPEVEINGIHFKVASKSLRPLFNEKKSAEAIDTIECPVCQKKMWLGGILAHFAHQTRNSDSGHAKLYLKFSQNGGNSDRARNNIRKWKERHQHGLAMLERIEQMEGNNGAPM